MHGGGIVESQGMHLVHTPVSEIVREFWRLCSATLASMNMAIRQGKGLEQLRERILGRCGIQGMRVLESSPVRNDRDVMVTLHSTRPLSAEEEYFVHRVVDEVNRRFGTIIRVGISRENN